MNNKTTMTEFLTTLGDEACEMNNMLKDNYMLHSKYDLVDRQLLIDIYVTKYADNDMFGIVVFISAYDDKILGSSSSLTVGKLNRLALAIAINKAVDNLLEE